MSAPGYDGYSACVATGMWVRKSQRTTEDIHALVSDIWYANHHLTCHGDGLNASYSDGSAFWIPEVECEFWPYYVWQDPPNADPFDGVSAVWEILDSYH